MNRFMRIMPLLFGLVGMVLLGVGAFVTVRSVEFKRRCKSADGTVVEIVSHRDSDGDRMYKPEVEWTDPAGQTRRFTSSVSSSSPGYSKGERVTVLFDPADPADARIDAFMELWLGSLVLGILGVTFSGVAGGFVLHGQWKKSRRNWLTVFGRRIQATVTGVDINRSLTVMNKHPWVIHAQWQDPATQLVHTFRSDSIWYDPTEFVEGETIDVLIDPNRPKVYAMDISFLPKQG